MYKQALTHLHTHCTLHTAHRYTASGWPRASTPVLRKLAGEPATGVFGKVRVVQCIFVCPLRPTPPPPIREIDVPTNRVLAHQAYAPLGKLYGDSEAAHACHAIDALCDAGAIATLLSTFIEPLQSMAGRE
jgi:hypothetical protein